MSQRADTLLYGLHSSLPLRYQGIYAGQWIAYALGIVLVTTTLIGPGIGLSPREVVAFGSRALIVTGFATLLQCYLGHGYPIIEGPGVIYWAMYLYTFQQATFEGAPLAEIEGGMLAAGVIIVLFARFGLVQLGARIFTPVLSGVTLVLISLSFLTTSATNLAGVSTQHPAGNPGYLAAVVLVIILGALLSLARRRMIRTVPVLLTALVSYAVFAFLGLVDFTNLRQVGLFAIPHPLAWGVPVFKPHIVFSFAVAGLLATVNTVAAVQAASDVYGHEQDYPRIRAGILVNGLCQVAAGLGAAAGTASIAGSVSVISLSRVGSRRAIVLAAVVLIVLGFVPFFSALLSTVPLAIVNGIFFLILANLFTLGVDQFLSLELDTRLRLIIGLSILAGLSVTYMPPALIEAIPFGGSFLLGNPIIVGTAVALIGEQLLFGEWLKA